MLLRILLKANDFNFRFLSGQELEQFLDRGKTVDGVRYPTAYVTEQGEAWGMFHEGKMVGGYVIATKGPFRTTLALEANGIKHNYGIDELIELGGLWIEKEYRIKRYSTCLWLHMRSRIKQHKKPYLIYGYNLQREGLKRLYAAAQPHVLFRGSPQVEGIKTHSTASIEVVNAKTTLFIMTILATGRIFRSFAVKSSRRTPLSQGKEANLENTEADRRILSK